MNHSINCIQKYKFITILFFLSFVLFNANGQDKKDIKYLINPEGTHYIQFTLLNQTWLRYNQSNAGTTVESEKQAHTLDIGLRRTRFQILGQITDKVFFYAQFGMNNFNAQFNSNQGNRKLNSFIHDALCEYKLTTNNELKLGGGLTINNGLSRFSQPSIGTIMTMDVPVFAQSTVDQTDEFSRKLSLYARGQIGHLDYRLSFTDPFPITSSGAAPQPIANFANFSPIGHRKQYQAYLMWQFFEHEGHNTPFMPGTYLGAKKVFNIAVGFIQQNKAMWLQNAQNDTIYQPMRHFAVESFLDMPINKEKGSAISAYLGYFNTNYGSNYLRYNGIMNPANGSAPDFTMGLKGQGPTFGNSFPMFGTGNSVYGQVGYLLPKSTNTETRFMPYFSTIFSKFDRLSDLPVLVTDAGINVLFNGHKAKLTLNWQNRPTFIQTSSDVEKGGRKNSVTLQYQISI